MERPRKSKIGTEVAHVTHDSDTTFKVKGQGHQGALLTAALTHQAAAAVSVETYWAWEPTATLPSAGAVGSAARGASAPTEGGEGRGIVWRPPAYSLLASRIIQEPLDRFLQNSQERWHRGHGRNRYILVVSYCTCGHKVRFRLRIGHGLGTSMGWVGLGPEILGWVGFWKSDPWPTLFRLCPYLLLYYVT